MTVKPLSIWLLLLLLIGGGLVDPNNGVTLLTVPASEEKELTQKEIHNKKMEEMIKKEQARLKKLKWGSVSKFIVPVFEVNEVTVEEVLGKLATWGVLISLEKPPANASVRFSLDIRNATVVQVLDTITEADGSYAWEPYRSSINPFSRVWIVNVFPRGAQEDPSSLMNIRVPRLELDNVRPKAVINRPYGFISELSRRYWELIPGPRGAAISDVTFDEMFLTLKLEDRSVREVLNEVSIRSGIEATGCRGLQSTTDRC